MSTIHVVGLKLADSGTTGFVLASREPAVGALGGAIGLVLLWDAGAAYCASYLI